MRYRKKPVIVEAVQWFKLGDHPLVIEPTVSLFKEVQDDPCDQCNKPALHHGYLDTEFGGDYVCPGNYIVTCADSTCCDGSTWVETAEEFQRDYERDEG